MFNKLIRHRFWICTGVILVLGICFTGAMRGLVCSDSSAGKPSTLMDDAKKYYMEGRYKKSANIYRKILVLEPDNADALLALAVICHDYTGRYEEAIRLYRKYLNLRPSTEKKPFIEEWISEAAHDSLGVPDSSRNTAERKAEELKKRLDEKNKETEKLKKQVEKLSGRIYTIQADYEEKLAVLRKEKDTLAGELTSTRARINTLQNSLSASEKSAKDLAARLEEIINKEDKKEEL